MANKPKGATGARALHTKVKKKRGLKNSSRRWLERHLNDPYVHRAKAEGYRSRAVYKLLEINERYDLIKKGQRVVDLGAAPGGWSQALADMVGSSAENTRIAAIDFLEMDPLPGVAFLQMDFLDDEAPDALMNALGGMPDLVLSDMAAPTIGHRKTDHIRTMYLCEVAADFAIQNLNEGGHFLAKTFQGGTEKSLLDLLRANFKSVHHVKPNASRSESVESFILAKSFKGRNKDQSTEDTE